ncbi:VCBS repeat-containing protein, partial [bacterium]|nr:VCBS repeat-containing protein [bacterium]
KEIITGAGAGGGPHVRVFSKDGKPLIGGFFAYDRQFNGGVSVAVGDVNNDGQGEIVVSPGRGGSPRVKIYNKEGVLINSFLAYDSSFLDGIGVGVADLDKDDNQEILVSTFNF